jgi:hypothetical protein
LRRLKSHRCVRREEKVNASNAPPPQLIVVQHFDEMLKDPRAHEVAASCRMLMHRPFELFLSSAAEIALRYV